MTIDIKLIKQLRERTGAGVADIREALEEASGNLKKAEESLRQKGFERASKKSDRATNAGLIDSYIHQGRVGALVEVMCETDFVARTEEFKRLTHEIAMQVASMNPKDASALLSQEYIRDPSKTVGDLIKETIAKLGENIIVARFSRFELGQ
jgi:elongation factor Ts